MLPKIRNLSHRLVLILVVGALLVFIGKQTSTAIHYDASQIIEPAGNYPTVSGFQNITIDDPNAKTVDLSLYIGLGDPENDPCYTITQNLEFDPMTKKVTYSWDSTTVIDHDYILLVTTYDSYGHVGGNTKLIRTSNGKTGEVCRPPYEPPLNPPPPSGDTPSSMSDTNDENTSQTTTTSETNTTADNSTKQEPTESTNNTSVSKKKDEEKKERKDALVIFDEEVPLELDRFDPDIFLKGDNVDISAITNITKDNNPQIHFEGKTKPSTLVTLYIFSTPVIVVVKSDLEGNWHYDREKPLEPGKHTIFATTYDDGVTRRSKTVDFFIARGTSEGQSLILSQTGIQKFYPYAAVVSGTVIIAVLILILYRIYSRRKQANI